ncbi:hypothetical protein EVAR_13715_1 [Eumeta japonica]|uniref:Uncharacterized protein n=1 Tax=Eumeta variegata TaxID=151549 RepID=A0A4C1UBN1_EUMVA|nr:hypothetical protein EVAR_13715_1 [Eumeta japonica]
MDTQDFGGVTSTMQVPWIRLCWRKEWADGEGCWRTILISYKLMFNMFFILWRVSYTQLYQLDQLFGYADNRKAAERTKVEAAGRRGKEVVEEGWNLTVTFILENFDQIILRKQKKTFFPAGRARTTAGGRGAAGVVLIFRQPENLYVPNGPSIFMSFNFNARDAGPPRDVCRRAVSN